MLTSYSHRRASVCNIRKINFLPAEEKSVLSFLHLHDVQSFSNLQKYCLLLLLESYTIPVLVSFCPVVVFQLVPRHCSTLVLVNTLEVIRYRNFIPFATFCLDASSTATNFRQLTSFLGVSIRQRFATCGSASTALRLVVRQL